MMHTSDPLAFAVSLPITGRVVAVSRAPKHDFAKQPQPAITLIAGEGVQDDAHRGIKVQHLYTQRHTPAQPNLCQVHLFAAEKLTELATQGYALRPGEIGENVLTQGLDLLALPLGTRLHLGPHAVVEITGLRTPCVKMDRHRAGLQKHLWGPREAGGKRTRRAGIMGIVLTGGDVRAENTIALELPPEPHLPLGPV